MKGRFHVFVAVTGGILFFLFQNCSPVDFSGQVEVESLCVPIEDPGLQPREIFRWDHENSVQPDWRQVMATPAVGDIDGDDIPEIVFPSYNGDATVAPGTYNGIGVLRVISGVDGKEKFAVTDEPLAPRGATSPLLIDIDGDGKAEIIYMHYQNSKVVALNSDGSLRWGIELPAAFNRCNGGPAAADLDADGMAEIIIDNYVLRESGGSPSVAFDLNQPSQPANCTSFAMSLDPNQPDRLQIVNGVGVFSAQGAPLWSFPDAAGGLNHLAAADIRPEISGIEVVSVVGGVARLYNGVTGALIWETPLPEDAARFAGPGRGGPPNIGDFTGDGRLEIAVAGAVFYLVIDDQGKILWQQANHDFSSNMTGSSLFDFNGDGTAEILYADEGYLRIFKGLDGTKISEIRNPSHTLLENPVVVDVNNDGHSEMIVPFNNAVNAVADLGAEGEAINGTGSGIRVFAALSETGWVNTRKVWNQYAYFVNNVTDRLQAASSTPTAAGEAQNVFRQNVLNRFDDGCKSTTSAD